MVSLPELATGAGRWGPDVLGEAFRSIEVPLGRDAAGEVVATVVSLTSLPNTRRGVLYIHGYSDYFFQEELARFYASVGVRFYGLDLRRCGRSIRPGQLPCFTTDLAEYFPEIDEALAVMRSEGVRRVLLNGHSTGGLVAALYAHRRRRRHDLDAVFLNSPFLEFPAPRWQRRLLDGVVPGVAAWAPEARFPMGLSPFYGQSVHRDHHGEWTFDTDWKPIEGFPLRLGWIRAIRRAQYELQAGLEIEVPVLVMASETSVRTSRWTPDYLRADGVLNVHDIREHASKLGPHLTFIRMEHGMHDLVLSAKPVRTQVYAELHRWLDTYMATE